MKPEHGISLVPFNTTFIDLAVIWHYDHEIADMIGLWRSYTVSELRQMIQVMLDDFTCKFFGVEKSGKPIGYIFLRHIDLLNKSAESHITLGDKTSWHKGHWYWAYKQLLQHAFSGDLSLHRVQTYVLGDRPELVKMMDKGPFGFRREGIMREAFKKHDRFLDVITYSVLNKEFKGE